MKKREYLIYFSALIMALIGFYPCQRFILWLRPEAVL